MNEHLKVFSHDCGIFILSIIGFYCFMNKIAFVLIILFYSAVSNGQELAYHVSFPNIAHHEGKFELVVTNAVQKSLIFRMSRSSPGRYATHEYGKNVYDVKAYGKSGEALKVDRLDGDVYQVDNKGGFTRFTYTLYANHPDGTYAGIDPSSIHLNIPAAFIWVKDLDKAPIEVTFDLPAGMNWTIATQLNATKDVHRYTAPNLQYFMDSPVKIGGLKTREWKVSGATSSFRLALEAQASNGLIDDFAEKLKKVTEETGAVFKAFPAFEGDQYTFLTAINPYVKGDGMEHRNSTVIHLPTVFTGDDNLLGVFSHEFFHAWNVERIRPKSLEPFNYEKSNMSQELWFAEGFTQYYGELILKRASFRSMDQFLGTVASLTNTKENTAGAKRISPAEASCMAVFVDAGIAVDKTNYPNTYTSYYPYGASIALALDLELRSRNLTLDRFMQEVWLKHGKTEIPYTIADLQHILGSVSGDVAFASTFFAKYIHGHERFDYAPLLQKAGMVLRRQFKGQAWLGDVRWKEGSAVILANTVMDTPIYHAGLDIDDQILKLDGQNVNSGADVDDILRRHKPGDQLAVEYAHRGEIQMSMITLSENPKLMVAQNEQAGLPVTAEMQGFRKQWLESKVVETK